MGPLYVFSLEHLFQHYVKARATRTAPLLCSPAPGDTERARLPVHPKHCGTQVWQCLWVMTKLMQILDNHQLIQVLLMFV
jgi:hypothetical protein